MSDISLVGKYHVPIELVAEHVSKHLHMNLVLYRVKYEGIDGAKKKVNLSENTSVTKFYAFTVLDFSV